VAQAEGLVIGGVEGSKSVAGAMGNAAEILESVLRQKDPSKELGALLEWVFSGEGLYLYIC